jgi:hypothetical protein
VLQAVKFCGKTLCLRVQKFLKEETDGQNSLRRIREVTRAVRSYREAGMLR